MDLKIKIKLLELDKQSLILNIEHYIAELDKLFKSPPSLDRGQKQARLVGNLERAKDIVKRTNYSEQEVWLYMKMKLNRLRDLF